MTPFCIITTVCEPRKLRILEQFELFDQMFSTFFPRAIPFEASHCGFERINKSADHLKRTSSWAESKSSSPSPDFYSSRPFFEGNLRFQWRNIVIYATSLAVDLIIELFVIILNFLLYHVQPLALSESPLHVFGQWSFYFTIVAFCFQRARKSHFFGLELFCFASASFCLSSSSRSLKKMA